MEMIISVATMVWTDPFDDANFTRVYAKVVASVTDIPDSALFTWTEKKVGIDAEHG